MKSQNCEKYEPIILLKCCSAETNFGKDLKAKPFIYDVSKHSVADDFHVFEDNDADEMKKKVFRMLAEIAIAKMLAE
nr:unnamed protein product [Meloidogyne enterolobii]CAD2184924.1 unnamed protein product [Meloidogyne enterolobii]